MNSLDQKVSQCALVLGISTVIFVMAYKISKHILQYIKLSSMVIIIKLFEVNRELVWQKMLNRSVTFDNIMT